MKKEKYQKLHSMDISGGVYYSPTVADSGRGFNALPPRRDFAPPLEKKNPPLIIYIYNVQGTGGVRLG